ncbi:MAG: TipAS antibiotic-recognition domain-containing protein [Firmicutes bacterium]|nr:TipAS antibiotic-recognition domain-containing protein [Bacillota bacterium]
MAIFDNNYYDKEAKQRWGETDTFAEFQEKSMNRTQEQLNDIIARMMAIIAQFGRLQDKDPSDTVVQMQVKKLQYFMTEHFYTCTQEVLSGLGQMYGDGGEYTKNINSFGGPGCGEFASKAIAIYCSRPENFR